MFPKILIFLVITILSIMMTEASPVAQLGSNIPIDKTSITVSTVTPPPQQ